MPTSLYELSIASYKQTLSGVNNVLQKGADYCQSNNINEDDMLKVRLIEDMLPLYFQLDSVLHHSIGSVTGMISGESGPPPSTDKRDYKAYQCAIKEAQSELSVISVESINELEGKNVTFKMGQLEIPFTVENFVMSFTLPNLNFHAATAYDILRSKGVPLGKKNFLGEIRALT